MSMIQRLGVMAFAVAVSLVDQAVAQTPYYATPSGWHEQSEPAFGFSIDAPAAVRRIEDSQEAPSVSLDFRDRDGQVMVQAIDFARAGVKFEASPDTVLDGMVEEFAGEHQLVLVEKRAVTVGAAAAREATYRSDVLNASMRIRFIFVQGRLYTLTGIGSAEGGPPPGYERVVNSFKLSPAPPPPGPGSR
jgi:hypothetical protein